MFESIQQVAPAVAAIRGRCQSRPRAGIVLGSGLGDLSRHVDVQSTLDYADIPHFPACTAPGHRGRLIFGRLSGLDVAVMDGRFHLYEGCRPQDVGFGVRVMHALGVELLILSNACGGLNPNYRTGDLLVVDDHLNLTFGGPLVGRHSAGVSYPDLSRPYDRRLAEHALDAARRHDIVAHRGVYIGVVGPNYETRAEYRMLRRIGGDAVGMSTVCETIVAVQCKLRVLALAVVTNVCSPDRVGTTDEQQVLSAAELAEPRLRAIVCDVLSAESRAVR
jgi:purine-nucleoside phosphorylase